MIYLLKPAKVHFQDDENKNNKYMNKILKSVTRKYRLPKPIPKTRQIFDEKSFLMARFF